MTKTVFHRVFGEGFRLFFAAACLCALLVIALWLASLAAAPLGLPDPLAGQAVPPLWHAHEMIFGFGLAAVAGVLLTSTGDKAASPSFLLALALLWAAGRVAMLWSPALPPVAVALVDLAFLPALGLGIAPLVPKLPWPQRAAFLLGPALLWAANLGFHLDAIGIAGASAPVAIRAALCAQVATMLLDGGRLIPGLTRNAMVQAGSGRALPRTPDWLVRLAAVAAFGLAAGPLVGAPDALIALLALVAGASTLARLGLWGGLSTFGKPLLWSLHLATAMSGLGLVMLGLSALGLGSDLAALHLLGIGGMGGMTLSVMLRTALGRTGRPVAACRLSTLALWLLPVAALVRAGTGPGTGSTVASIGAFVSGGLWLVSVALFATALWPILRDPRQPRAAVTSRPRD